MPREKKKTPPPKKARPVHHSTSDIDTQPTVQRNDCQQYGHQCAPVGQPCPLNKVASYSTYHEKRVRSQSTASSATLTQPPESEIKSTRFHDFDEPPTHPQLTALILKQQKHIAFIEESIKP